MSRTQTNGKAVSDSIDERRAAYEEFSFRVPAEGFVNVANHSYGDSEAGEHCYTVEIANGEAIDCSCPHATYRDAHCKHQVACESVEAVMLAASEESR
jgi:hypothetical protein